MLARLVSARLQGNVYIYDIIRINILHVKVRMKTMVQPIQIILFFSSYTSGLKIAIFCRFAFSVFSQKWFIQIFDELTLSLIPPDRNVSEIQILKLRPVQTRLGICCGQWYRVAFQIIGIGREPWSSGYGSRLTFQRSWVQIPAPDTGWTWHFSHSFIVKIVLFVWKDRK